MMDNIESGIQSSELDDAFWNNMRYLGSHVEKLGFCVASRYSCTQLEELAIAQDKSSPIYNVFDEVKLGPLTEKEGRTFLQRTSLPKKDAGWILQQSHYWPVLLQELYKTQLESDDRHDWKKVGLEKTKRYQYLWASDSA